MNEPDELDLPDRVMMGDGRDSEDSRSGHANRAVWFASGLTASYARRASRSPTGLWWRWRRPTT